MFRWFYGMVVILVWTVSFAAAKDNDHDESDTDDFVREMIVRAHQKLTTGLYKAFARKEGNLLLSPWSVMTLLTVTYMVAGGRTASEIGDHLNINLLRRKEVSSGFEHINNIFKNSDNGSEVLESVNGAYIGKRLHPKRRLKKLLSENLNTYIDRIITNEGNDRKKDGGKSQINVTSGRRKAFQGLLKEKNLGQLEGLLPGNVDLESKMSLWFFNLISFQGVWKSPFNHASTHNADFLVEGRDRVRVATMETKASFPRSYYPKLEMTLVELPYGQGDRHGLFVLLPDKADGLSQLEKKLRHFSLESMLTESHWVRQTRVFLPKFKFQTEVTLNEAMKKLGFRRMFSPEDADFSRLNPDPSNGRKSPYVQTMLHRAAIEVNEDGTTASAGTAMRLTTRRYAAYFRVNHPFMFVLRDKSLGINLFVGRVTDPRQLS